MYDQLITLYEKFNPPLLTNFRLDRPDVEIPARGAAFVLLEWDERFVFIKRKAHPDHPGWEKCWWFP